MVTASLAISNLANQNEWEMVFDGILLPSPTGYMNNYDEIVDSSLLTIGVGYKRARRNWKFGGNAWQKLLFTPDVINSNFGSRVNNQKVYLKLNELTLVQFENYGVGIPYQLTIEFPQWLREIELQVWKYTG